MDFRRHLYYLALVAVVACGPGFEDAAQTPVDGLSEEEGAFSSAEAMLLDFTFQGEVFTTGTLYSTSAKQKIQDQLLYTIGQLNEKRSVGRLDRLQLSDVRAERQPDGTTRITYRAVLPVAWGSRVRLPETYGFVLPRDVSHAQLAAFTERYSQTCVDGSAHDVDQGSMWYYYRPNRMGCALEPTDVVRFEATVARSTLNTTGKYPEYHRVWEDDVLDVVAIFGKYEDGATTESDAGVAAYNQFVRALRSELRAHALVTTPAVVPDAPGVALPDVTFEATMSGGKRIKVSVLLVDNVRVGNPDYDFDARYEALSPSADVIMYNGHAGLGQNVRALAGKGRFVPGKYLIVFMNGCDTFAYVDGSLAEARARLNPDDPSGTKYMEMVTNAMPAYFHQMPTASLALLRGLSRHAQPVTYEAMFRNVDRQQVVVVTGEEDNVFTPEYGHNLSWTGLEQSFTVRRDEAQHFSTPTLPAGRYLFELSGSGDGDLYVRQGSAPTASQYDCRPYRSGSAERCVVELLAPATLHVMVHGYGANSALRLVGKPE